MALVISLHRFRQDRYAEPFVANRHLDALNVALQAHLQTSTMGIGNGLELLRTQVQPLLQPIEDSELLGPDHLAKLRSFADPSVRAELTPSDLEDLAARVGHLSAAVQQARSPEFQSGEGVPSRRLMRMTGPLRTSVLPSSLRSMALAGQGTAQQATGGRYIRVAIIATDLVDYEPKSSRVPQAEEVVRTLNQRYFYRFQEILRAYGIKQDKFIGDAMLAYSDSTNNAERAVKAALDMQEAVRQINREARQEAMRSVKFREKLRQMDKEVDDLSSTELEALISEVDPLIFEMRVGVNWGEVNQALLGNPDFYSERTIMGSPVNTAARLESACPNGEVCVSDAVVRELPEGMFDLKPKGEVQIKKAKFNVHLVLRSHNVGGTIRTQGKVQLPVQGREAEIKFLEQEMLATAVDRRPHFVLLQGAPGEGKSTIADAFTKRIPDLSPETRNADIIIGRGDFVPDMQPYYVMAEMLRRRAYIQSDTSKEERERRIRALAAEAETDSGEEKESFSYLLAQFLDEPLDNPPPRVEYLLKEPNELRNATYEMLVKLFAGLTRERPVLLVMDDLQWVDLGTRRLLHTLMTRLSDRPLMVLAPRRNEPYAVDEPQWFDGPFASCLVELEPLGERSLEGIVRQVLGDSADARTVQTILERSGKNPLFAQEIAVAVKGGMAPDRLPGTVQELFQNQLLQLDEAPLGVLKMAGVVGREFSEEDLRAMGAIEPALFLSGLIESDFIAPKEDEKGSYQFRHDLLKQAVLDMMEGEEKKMLHAAYARHLEESGSEDHVLLASHFREGGEGEKASAHFIQAAREAYGKGAYKTASLFYERAFDLTADPKKQLEVLFAWDDAILYDGRTAELVSVILPRLDQTAPKLPISDREMQANVRLTKGHVFQANGRHEEAEKVFLDGLSFFRDDEPSPVKCKILNALGNLYSQNIRDNEKAQSCYEKTLLNAKRMAGKESSYLVGVGWVNLSYIHTSSGDYHKGYAAALNAIEGFRAANDLKGMLYAIRNAGGALILLGNYEEALKLFNEGIEISKTKMNNFLLAVLHAEYGWAAHLLGEDKEAVEHLGRARVLHAKNPDTFPSGRNHVYLSLYYSDKRDPQVALEEANEALRIGRVTKDRGDLLQAMALMAVARAKMGQGDLPGAIEASQRSMSKTGIQEFDSEILLTHAELLMRSDMVKEALATIDRAKKRLEEKASRISSEDYRSGFLTRVKVNRETFRLWQTLNEMTSRDLSAPVRTHLARLNYYPSRMPEEASFIDLSRPDIMHKDPGRGKPYARAGKVIDLAPASVLSHLLSEPFIVPKNEGQVKGVWAQNIEWAPFFGQDQRLYVHLKWKIGSKIGALYRPIFRVVGERANYQHLLRDNIYDRDGAVYIELEEEPRNAITSFTGIDIKIPEKERVESDRFGKLQFVIVPLSEERTIVVLEMYKELFTRNPWTILEALDQSVKARKS